MKEIIGMFKCGANKVELQEVRQAEYHKGITIEGLETLCRDYRISSVYDPDQDSIVFESEA